MTSVVTLGVFLIPLIAVLISYDAFVGEQEHGTLILLLTYPLSRTALLTGKLLGQSAALGVCLLLGFSVLPLLTVFIVSFLALFGALMAVKFSSFAEMPANFWGFLFCGVLWGFSFIIPGMTSSSILMAVGLLTPLIDGIAQLDLAVLIPWGLGMAGVMALFARIVSRLFDTHYSIAYHAVIGIVLASTIIIIPTDFASTAEMVWGIACAILGAVLAYFGSKLQPQEDAEIEAK